VYLCVKKILQKLNVAMQPFFQTFTRGNSNKFTRSCTNFLNVPAAINAPL